MNIEVVTIDEKKYMIMNQMKDNNITYFYLSNVDDENDIMIRKAYDEDLDTLLVLDNKEEVDKALALLNK